MCTQNGNSKMIRTGYYKAKDILKQSNPVFICRSINVDMQSVIDEVGCTPKRYIQLAPPYKEILEPWYNSKLTYKGFTELYYEHVLSKLDPHIVAEELGPDPILICYEKVGDFCHRHIVADWLRAAGYTVEEYRYTTPIPAAVQDEWIF